MSSSRSHHNNDRRKYRHHTDLRLPSSRDVTRFREQRLLIHLHEQLTEQLEISPNDWMLHFQLANLLAFSDDYSYSHDHDKEKDINEAEIHYQKCLKLLQLLHEQDYTIFKNRHYPHTCHRIEESPMTPFGIDSDNMTDNEDGGAMVDGDSGIKTRNRGGATIANIDTDDEQKGFSMIKEPIEGNGSESESDSYFRQNRRRQRQRRKKKSSTKVRRRQNSKPGSFGLYQIGINQNKLSKRTSLRSGSKIKDRRDSRDKSNKTSDSLSQIKANIDNTSLFAWTCNVDEPLQESPTPKTKMFKRKNKNKKSKKPKMKKRKLLIKIIDDDETVSEEIKCKYTSAMSDMEIQRELEKKRKANKKPINSKVGKLRLDITAKYLNAVSKSFHTVTSRKRPSIIEMLIEAENSPRVKTPRKSKKSNNKRISNSNKRESELLGLYTPISLIQSESTEAITLQSEYSVPEEIVKGYTECFFGYGKYLYKNNRTKEGIHNLLDCASWYDDSFVDPSCLSSLVLPPQFLFQDSVKKRHCINFRTLTKFVSKILGDEQKRLDKTFKQMNIPKYQREYEQYVQQWQERNLINIPDDRDDINTVCPETILVENTTSSGYSSDGLDLRPALSNGLSNGFSNGYGSNNLRLDPVRSNGTDISMVSPSMISPSSQSFIVPGLNSAANSNTPGLRSPGNSNRPGWNSAANSNSVDAKKKDAITYDVYPQDVQDLVSEYTQLCKSLHRLGLLLSDYMRYGDAKREYSKALGIFRKLKIKPQLYEDILAEIRISQRNAATNKSSRNRAQHLAKRTPTTGSRSRAPQSPSFSFSFSHHAININNTEISPFMLTAAK